MFCMRRVVVQSTFKRLHTNRRLQSTLKPNNAKSWLFGLAALVTIPAVVYLTAPKDVVKAKQIIKKPVVKQIKEDLPLIHGKDVVELEDSPTTDTEAETLVDSDPGELIDTEKEILNVKYVLVGSGVASFTAIKGIRDNDKEGAILMVSEESELPYQKPPMSKELWISGNDALEFKDWSGKNASIYYKNQDYFESQNVALAFNKQVVAIDSDSQIITLDNGTMIRYEKLLLATGSKPVQLPISTPFAKSNTFTFRDLKDYTRLKELAKQQKHILVIGGGFLGSELAAGLVHNGATVTQVYPENGNLGLVLPDYLSEHCKSQVEALNVAVHSNVLVTDISSQDDKIVVSLSDNTSISADNCVVCVGCKPNTELAKSSGLEIDNNGGLLVNSELIATSNIYGAGDLISFYDPILGRRRIEHYDHAAKSGYHAGFNMSNTTSHKPYTYQPMFWSDVGPTVSFEAVGLLNSKLKTKSFWNMNSTTPFDKGVVFYINKDDKIGNSYSFSWCIDIQYTW